jgi:hypothetical protein
METQRIELSNSEVATAIEILNGEKEGNKKDADTLMKSIIKGSDLIAELPSGFDLKQFQK